MLTERSVSRAAVRLGMHQPAVSAALKRLRDLAGDPLLVRSGASMMPTDAALRMVEPAALILRSAEALFSDARGLTRARPPEPSVWRPATIWVRSSAPAGGPYQGQRPLCPIEILPLSADAHYHAHLAQGDVDVVIGNWPQPPDDLHMGRLFGDEVVCLVRTRTIRRAPGLDRGRLAGGRAHRPTPTHPGARGVIDAHLDSLGLSRNITARVRAFQRHSAHRGFQPAGLDHRAPVLRTVHSAAAAGHPAQPGGVSKIDVLPAVACAHPPLGCGHLVAGYGQVRRRVATKRIAACAC